MVDTILLNIFIPCTTIVGLIAIFLILSKTVKK